MDKAKFAECKDAIQQLVKDLDGFCQDYQPDVAIWALIWFTLQYTAHCKTGGLASAAVTLGDVAQALAEDEGK